MAVVDADHQQQKESRITTPEQIRKVCMLAQFLVGWFKCSGSSLQVNANTRFGHGT